VSKIHQAPGAFVSCNTTRDIDLLVENRSLVSNPEGRAKVNDNTEMRTKNLQPDAQSDEVPSTVPSSALHSASCPPHTSSLGEQVERPGHCWSV
jgi:hypothetical protein